MTSALVLALLLGAAPTVESPDERLDEPYALTISGGVSLGSYEAGLNWTLVRAFRAQAEMSALLDRRRPHLVAVTGASAGSINALLVAALYCEAGDLGWSSLVQRGARPLRGPHRFRRERDGLLAHALGQALGCPTRSGDQRPRTSDTVSTKSIRWLREASVPPHFTALNSTLETSEYR